MNHIANKFNGISRQRFGRYSQTALIGIIQEKARVGREGSQSGKQAPQGTNQQTNKPQPNQPNQQGGTGRMGGQGQNQGQGKAGTGGFQDKDR